MLALRNLLLFLFGVSIPLTLATSASVFLETEPNFGVLIATLSAWVPIALWLYVAVLFFEAYYDLRGK